MNRKGLELLQQLEIVDNEASLNQLLQSNLLPILFKVFISHYQVGENWTRGDLILVDEQTGRKVGLTQISMYEPTKDNGYHACLDYIFDYPRLLTEIDNYRNKAENWNDLGFIQIGLMYWSDVLLLGVENNNRGEIWRYGTGDLNETCSKLANNIFEFMGRLQESIDHESLDDHNIDLDQLYRNLSEPFWRVKPKENL